MILLVLLWAWQGLPPAILATATVLAAYLAQRRAQRDWEDRHLAPAPAPPTLAPPPPPPPTEWVSPAEWAQGVYLRRLGELSMDDLVAVQTPPMIVTTSSQERLGTGTLCYPGMVVFQRVLEQPVLEPPRCPCGCGLSATSAE